MLKLCKYWWVYVPCFLLVLGLGACEKLNLKQVAAVETNQVVVGGGEVKAYGTVVDVSENGLTDHGHCWDTTSAPTADGLHSSLGPMTAPGIFSSSLGNLNANTTYFVRSYILTGSKYVYGDALSFSLSTDEIVLTTGSHVIVDEATVTIQGGITGIGSLQLQDYGHCWSLTFPPTIANAKSSLGTLAADNDFTSTMQGLDMDTIYFVRAYAQVDDTTVLYGNGSFFKIPPLQVTTDAYALGTDSTVTLAGFLELGIYTVQEYGFCWSNTSSSPDYNDDKILGAMPAQEGLYYCVLTDVTPGITYYYRAYAYVGNSIVYGVTYSFQY